MIKKRCFLIHPVQLANCLINYILEPTEKRWVVLKINFFFRANRTKDCNRPTHENNLYGARKKHQKNKNKKRTIGR